MTIDEALEALTELESGPHHKDQHFGPERWVENFFAGDDAFRARSHQVAWTLVHDGAPGDRRHALEFWQVVSPPDGVSDALAELYLGEQPPDPNLRQNVGRYVGHRFSDDVGHRLAQRFAADPENERDLATNAVQFDAQGAAWDALIRLVLKTDDMVGLYGLFDAAYVAQRADDFFAALKGKPTDVLEALAEVLPATLRPRFQQLTGIPRP